MCIVCVGSYEVSVGVGIYGRDWLERLGLGEDFVCCGFRSMVLVLD